MLDLAWHAHHGPVSLADISERQGISLSYLEQLFAKLRRGSLVTSVRGPGGGYQLSRDMAGIQVAQVIDAVNESVDATRCQGLGGCHSGDTCLRSEEHTSELQPLMRFSYAVFCVKKTSTLQSILGYRLPTST